MRLLLNLKGRGQQGGSSKERGGVLGETSVPEIRPVEPAFEPEIPVALKRTKFAALAVWVLAFSAEKIVAKRQKEAYEEAGLTANLYERSLQEPATLPLLGQEQPLNTSAADKAALLYADSMITAVVGSKEAPAGAEKQALLRDATRLVIESHEDPILRSALIGVATQEWRAIATRELRETAEDLSETPIDRAKKALETSTTGRLSDEHKKAISAMLPIGVSAIMVAAPFLKILEHAVREVGESLTENADLVERTLHRQDRFGKYFTGDAQERGFYLGQLQTIARQKGIEVGTEDLATFSSLVAAKVLLDQTHIFEVTDGKVNVPQDIADIVRYATIAGVVDGRQSARRTQTEGRSPRR